MPVEWFLKIDGVPGSSRNRNYPDDLEVRDWRIVPRVRGNPMQERPFPVGTPIKTKKFDKLFVLRTVAGDAVSGFLRTRLEQSQTGSGYQQILGRATLTYIAWIRNKETPRTIVEFSPLSIVTVRTVFVDGWKELITFGFLDAYWASSRPETPSVGALVHEALRFELPGLVAWSIGEG